MNDIETMHRMEETVARLEGTVRQARGTYEEVLSKARVAREKLKEQAETWKALMEEQMRLEPLTAHMKRPLIERLGRCVKRMDAIEIPEEGEVAGAILSEIREELEKLRAVNERTGKVIDAVVELLMVEELTDPQKTARNIVKLAVKVRDLLCEEAKEE